MLRRDTEAQHSGLHRRYGAERGRERVASSWEAAWGPSLLLVNCPDLLANRLLGVCDVGTLSVCPLSPSKFLSLDSLSRECFQLSLFHVVLTSQPWEADPLRGRTFCSGSAILAPRWHRKTKSKPEPLLRYQHGERQVSEGQNREEQQPNLCIGFLFTSVLTAGCLLLKHFHHILAPPPECARSLGA